MKLLTFKKFFKSLVGVIAQMDQLCSLRLVTEVRYFQKYEAFIGELCCRRPASYVYGAGGRAFGHPPKPVQLSNNSAGCSGATMEGLL